MGFSYFAIFMQNLASPTTGAFAGEAFNRMSNSAENQLGVKREEKFSSDFSFQPQTKPAAISSTVFQSSSNTVSAVCVNSF
jgi:WRKY transcription factor 33